MNCKLRQTSMVPPGGYWYREPSTGVIRDGQSLVGTIKQTVEHRLSNNLPRQSFEEAREDIECQICQRIPPEFCTDPRCSVVAPERVTTRMLITGSLALWKWISSKLSGREPFVDQAEADRRAAICARCFLNVAKLQSCSNCAKGETLREAIGVTIGDRTTNRDGALGACGVCGCLNRITVWFSGEIISETMTDDLRAKYKTVPGCWKSGL
jgi:hypothetical protein